MLYKWAIMILMGISLQVHGKIAKSCLPQMDIVYTQDFDNKVNAHQKANIQHAIKHQHQKLRVMTYNMLYNEKSAEDLLPERHRWGVRKSRLLEYLNFVQADLIGSQELQEDQLKEVINAIGNDYNYYGLKTRKNEGRTDTNESVNFSV